MLPKFTMAVSFDIVVKNSYYVIYIEIVVCQQTCTRFCIVYQNMKFFKENMEEKKMEYIK